MIDEEKQRFQYAKKYVRRLRLFYIHLAAFIVFVTLLLYNLYIVSGSYKNNIISLNLSVIGVWSVVMVIHGFNIFKEKGIFNKRWEDSKIKRFLKDKEEETTYWE